MIPTKTYPLSAIMGDQFTDKERVAELTDAFNKVCDENADFVEESNKDEARIADLEAQITALQEEILRKDVDHDRELLKREAERDVLRRDAERYRWIAADPRNRGSLEWLEADEINAHIDAALQSRSEEWPEMCPNCVTPWKCNGPHIAPERRKGERRVGPRIPLACNFRAGQDRRKS